MNCLTEYENRNENSPLLASDQQRGEALATLKTYKKLCHPELVEGPLAECVVSFVGLFYWHKSKDAVRIE